MDNIKHFLFTISNSWPRVLDKDQEVLDKDLELFNWLCANYSGNQLRL